MTPIRLYTAIRDAMEKHFALPMSPARSINALALLELCGEGVSNMSTHAATLKLTSAGITTLSDRLEKQGLIKRQNPPGGDRRQWNLHITLKGRTVLSGIYHDTRVALSRAKAQQADETEPDKARLQRDLLAQDIEEIRDIIAKGGSAADVLRFLDAPQVHGKEAA